MFAAVTDLPETSPAHKDAGKRATAALLKIVATARDLEAATLLGARREDIEVYRVQAHDLLDAYLDQTAEAAVAVRSIAER
jgi:hypothetical protein